MLLMDLMVLFLHMGKLEQEKLLQWLVIIKILRLRVLYLEHLIILYKLSILLKIDNMLSEQALSRSIMKILWIYSNRNQKIILLKDN